VTNLTRVAIRPGWVLRLAATPCDALSAGGDSEN